VARALNLVGYNTLTFRDIEEFRDRESVLDEEIIPWLAKNDVIWVHADDNAKRAHKKLILAEGVLTLWIYRPGGKLSAKDQLRILAYVLPALLQYFAEKPRQRHYRAYAHGQPPMTKATLRPLIL